MEAYNSLSGLSFEFPQMHIQQKLAQLPASSWLPGKFDVDKFVVGFSSIH
jgi:hypothetical protein